MASTRLSLNRCIIAGKATSDPLTRQLNTRHGDTTLTTFTIRTPNDTYVGPITIEIQAWARTATIAQHITKGRTVAIDGQLTQHDYLDPNGKKQTKTSLRADRIQLLDSGNEESSEIKAPEAQE